MALKTLEQFTAEAQTEVDALKTANGGDGMFAQVNNVRREFTDAEYDQAVTDIANYKFDEQNNGYKRKRQEEYPSIPDQLDDIYHNGVAGGFVLTVAQATDGVQFYANADNIASGEFKLYGLKK